MNADPRSVALLTPQFWPEACETRERIVHDLAQELLTRGHRPRVITSHPGRPGRSVERGIPITRHWRPPEPWTLRNVESGLSHLPFAYASLQLEAPAVAHAFHPNDALAALRWSRGGGGPTVLSCMSVLTRESIAAKRLRRTILEQVVYGADAIVAPSGAVRDALWRWFGVEAELVPAEEVTTAAAADAYLATYERVLAGGQLTRRPRTRGARARS